MATVIPPPGIQPPERMNSLKLRIAIALFYNVIAQEIKYLTEDRATSRFGILAVQIAERIERILFQPYSRVITIWILINRNELLASSMLVEEIAYFIATYSRKYEEDERLSTFVASIDPNLSAISQRYNSPEQLADDAEVIYGSIEKIVK